MNLRKLVSTVVTTIIFTSPCLVFTGLAQSCDVQFCSQSYINTELNENFRTIVDLAKSSHLKSKNSDFQNGIKVSSQVYNTKLAQSTPQNSRPAISDELIIIYRNYKRLSAKNLDSENSRMLINDLDRYLEKSSKDALAYYLRAGLKFMIKDLKGALNDLDQVIMYDSEDNVKGSWALRASIKGLLKDYLGAISDYTQSIARESDPTAQGASYYGRGLTNMEVKDYQSALDDFDKVLELAPNQFPDARELRNSAQRLLKKKRN